MMSLKPSKQRLAVYTADLDERRGMVAAHLSKELRSQYKRRSMPVRKGDEVKIIRGDNFGKTGEVTQVDSRKYMIFVNGVNVKRTIGTEKQMPIEPSNVVITSLALSDNMRQRILLRKVKEVVVPKPKPAPVKTEQKAEEKAAETPAAEKHDHAHGDHAQHSHEGHTHAEHVKQEKKAPSQAKRTAPKNAAGKGGK